MALLIEHWAVGPLRCNCTLIGDTASGEAVIIDPGGDASRILAWLETHQLRLTRVLHTHAHFDHFWASGLLREKTQATLSLHKSDLFLWRLFPKQCQLFGIPQPEGVMPEPDSFLEHEQPIAFSPLPGTVLHTPGHSPGSCCFHFASRKLLLAGDTLFRRGIGRTDLWGGSAPKIEHSIKERLFKPLEESTTVIAGHGPSTTLKEEMEQNPYVGIF